MFYRLACGCIVLPLEKRADGWQVLDIDRCDRSQYDYDSSMGIGGERFYPFDLDISEGNIGHRKIEDGAELTPEQDQNIWHQLRSLVHDGYRFREIRAALKSERDIKVEDYRDVAGITH